MDDSAISRSQSGSPTMLRWSRQAGLRPMLAMLAAILASLIATVPAPAQEAVPTAPAAGSAATPPAAPPAATPGPPPTPATDAPSAAPATPVAKPAPARAARKADAAPILALLPLESKGVTADEAGVLTDALASELLSLGAFRVMERAQMDQILAEQGFQQSGACNASECAVEMGRLLGLDRMAVGSVGHIGRTYVVSIRLVEVETGEVVRSVSRSQQGAIDEMLTLLIPSVAAELAGKKGAAQPPIAGNRSPVIQVPVPLPAEILADSVLLGYRINDDAGLARTWYELRTADGDSVLGRREQKVQGTASAGMWTVSLAGMPAATYTLRLVAEDRDGAVTSSDFVFARRLADTPPPPRKSTWGWWLAGGTMVAGGGAAAAFLLLSDKQQQDDGSQQQSSRAVEVSW